MALIGADVHANGPGSRLIPRSRSSNSFVCSYVREMPYDSPLGSLFGQGAQPAESAVLRDPYRAG